MKLGDKFKKRVEDGLKGEYEGYDTGIEGIETLQRGIKYVIAGGTGTGKSQLAVNNHGWNPLWDYMDNYRDDPDRVFHWYYFSLEMRETDVLLRLGSYLLFKKYGMIIPPNLLGSTGKEKMNAETVKSVLDIVVPALNEVDEYVTIVMYADINGIKKRIEDFYRRHGKLTIENGQQVYKTKKHITCIGMVDHGSLLTDSELQSVKARIDSFDNYAIYTSNIYLTTWVYVQQTSRGEASVSKLKRSDVIKPDIEDLADSGNPSKSAEIVLAVFNPARYNIATYLGYDITERGLHLNQRFLWLLKGRFVPEGCIPCAFYGESGTFKKLPRLSDMKREVDISNLYEDIKQRKF